MICENTAQGHAAGHRAKGSGLIPRLKSNYLSRVGRGAGALALSMGYRSRTANLTSSASSVRNRRMFKMTYSWSVRTMFPCEDAAGTVSEGHARLPAQRGRAGSTALTLSYSSMMR